MLLPPLTSKGPCCDSISYICTCTCTVPSATATMQFTHKNGRKRHRKLFRYISVEILHLFCPCLVQLVQPYQWHSQYKGKVGQSAPLDSEKFAKNQEKEGKSGKKEKSGRKGKNREGSFTLPLLADGYTTGPYSDTSMLFT